MRRSLGTAVFSGMFGVTLFGIFLTPVFFYVIDGLSETRVCSWPSPRSGSAPSLWAGWSGAGHRLLPGRGSASAQSRPWPWRVGAAARRVIAALRSRRSTHCIDRPPTKGDHRHDFPLLHRPSDLRLRAVDRVRAGRRGGRVHAAGGPISRGHPAHGAGHGDLSGRQRPDRPRHGGRADRGAGQRRRGHDVHVVAVHQRRHLPPDGHLQAGHGLRHGPGAGAEPRLAGAAGHSAAWSRTRASRSRRSRPTR